MRARSVVLAALSGTLSFAAAAQTTPQWGAPPSAPSALGGQRDTATPATLPQQRWTPPPAVESTQRPLATSQASQMSRATGAASTAPSGALFRLPDDTPITVDGRRTVASELKKSVQAQIAARAAPRHSVQAPLRAGAAAPPVARVSAGAVQLPTRGGTWQGGAPSQRVTAVASGATMAIGHGGRGLQDVDAKAGTGASSLFCSDNGPPAINEVDGVLTPGGTATVYGRCFGEQAGHVEVIGATGNTTMAFTKWNRNEVDLQVPANLRGPDGDVSVTVVGSDGRRSPAVVGRFRAARQDVEVPARLWQPTAAFDITDTTNGASFLGQPVVNTAAAGQLVRSLRINPACTLASMVVDVISGDVSEIRGFEQGPPNEATTTILWTGTCVDTKTTTTTDYVFTTSTSTSTSKACRVTLEPRAWASCPVGASP